MATIWIPRIIMVALLTLNLCMGLVSDAKREKPGTCMAISFVAYFGQIGLLWLGGFFSAH